MTPLGELALVGSPLKVPSSQGSTAATTPIDRIREPTSCTLVFLSSRQNTVMEVATGVAHPPGGLHHNNKIPPVGVLTPIPLRLGLGQPGSGGLAH